MRKIYLVCFAAVALMMTAFAQESQAQRPAHFYPARPTFSSYLLYRQFNGTGIPNYYQYVRPETEFRDYVTRNPPVLANRRQVLTVEQRVDQVLDSQLRQRLTTGIGNPSVPGQFNNTGHYYQRPAPRRRP